MASKQTRKCTTLPLKRKIELIDQVENGKKQKNVALDFGISPNTVSTIMKDKARYREAYNSGKVDDSKMRQRQAKFDDVDEALLQWFDGIRANGAPLNGPIIKLKAMEIARQLGKPDWDCGDGWLGRFKKRHNLAYKRVCGESVSVDTDQLEDWMESVLRPILKKYKPCDVYNADETGLFWRLLPDKTMAYKGEAVHGTKTAKDRITVLCCANMDGSHKLPLLVIGKFKNPRCFKGVGTLPVSYEANKKAWMTGELFIKWLTDFDKKINLENRKVLMVVDNCPAHPKNINLKATELLFLPPNVTSMAQPCDMGIINNLKHHYRGALLSKVIQHLNSGANFSDFKPSLLDAIVLIKSSWAKVQESTVANCFRKAGFVITESHETSTLPDDSRNILEELYREFGINTEVEDIEDLDAGILCTEVPEAVEPVASTSTDDDDNDDQGEAMHVVSDSDLMGALKTIEHYFLQKGIEENTLLSLNKAIDNHKMKAKVQCSIKSFFRPKQM